MNRTINERKALKHLTFGFPSVFLSLISYGVAIRYESTIAVIISMLLLFYGLFAIHWGAYSLGWEYKRMSVEARN